MAVMGRGSAKEGGKYFFTVFFGGSAENVYFCSLIH